MKHLIARLFAVTVLMTAFAAAGHAQASRTWVSGVGDDANPGSRTAPCKTWAGAISKTAAGGEIDALDPGGFGGLTITKSIKLDGGGGQVASVLVAGTNGIVIAAGSTDVVTIRNVRFEGLLGNGSAPANAGIDAIKILSAKSVTIENCYIDGFNTDGIQVAAGANCQVTVINTKITNCANAGIQADTTAGTLYVAVRNCEINNCTEGVLLDSTGTAEVSDTHVTDTDFGLEVKSGGNLDSLGNTVSNSGIAVYSGSTTQVVLSNTDILNSNDGIRNAGGTVISYGNNHNIGNAAPGAPTSTLTPQ